MRLYDCRHTAISMALHPLAAMAGHNVQTLENYYRRIIGKLVEECAIVSGER
jgi:hypothetical protein